MRDPKRIDKFCAKLAGIWKYKCPDWRFGQLMSNFQRWCAGNGIDIFFLEENKTLELFKEFLGVSEKNKVPISDLHLIFKIPCSFDGAYEKWDDDVLYVPNIYLHGSLENIAHIDRCGVVGEQNFYAIKNLKNKERIKVEIIINDKTYPATLYIWKQNVVKGLIVADDDDVDVKNYAKSMWESESYIL